MKRYFIILICLCLVLGGCGKKKEDDRVLEGFDNPTVQEVKDFSAYEETETETETETEPPTEPPTEQPTEPPTETETEPIEEPFAADYEFSEYNVLQAVFHRFGGLGAIPYVSSVVQDLQSKTRIQTVTAMDGGIVVTLEADAVSGSSYKKVTLDYSVDDGENALADALLGFDNGISDSNIESFLSGAYNGGNAPLIGLADASYMLGDGHAVAVLVKNDMAEGEVPYWEAAAADSTHFVPSAKFHRGIADGEDIFSEMLQGIELSPVVMDSAAYTSYSKVTDEKGNVTGGGTVFQAAYHTDDGHSYEITLSDAADDTHGMTVTCHRPDATTQAAILPLSEHLYQYLFEGTLDMAADLSAGYSTGHCSIAMTGDGFSIRFF